MVFKVTNSLTNSTKTEQNQDSLIRYLEEEHNRASNLNYTANIHISNIDKKNQIISEISCELPFPSKQDLASPLYQLHGYQLLSPVHRNTSLS